MFRIPFILLILAVLPASGQQPGPLFVNRPVLKALPLGGDGDPASRPLPNAPAPPGAETPTPIETVSPPSPLDAKPSGDDAVRLQIFLDEANFGPGVIDGKPGLFTELAVRSWNEVNGHPVDDWIAVNTAARKAVDNPFAVALVPEIAQPWVDPELPSKRSLQAKKKRMSYRSVAEFMSERYHCDVPYLALLNTWPKINALKPHDSIIVPNVTPFHVEKLTGARYEADPALSQRHVVVDTKKNQVRIFEAAPAALIIAEPGAGAVQPVTRANRGLVASFPITPGQPKFIKFGTWELRNMVELPWWRYDQQLLDTGKRGDNALNIPPGPNSPVGIIWNGTSKPGIGMHGTSDPETIGRARSSGCIRLANWDAIRLPNIIRPGATVEIR
ncbi:MAG: L,D-transpeptidase [Luteolibacter sp.]|jgi:lipoprotein-anchoring transpeptidase ErfK/SrfK|nr:L,D-transpeptidase [Luteolibacter sp.]